MKLKVVCCLWQGRKKIKNKTFPLHRLNGPREKWDFSLSLSLSIESQVQGVECIYGCYVHSAILPTFHRRCYWLLQNPDVVLVHYLNVPYPDGDAKLAALPPCLALPPDKKEWTRDELASQLRPMFLGGDDDPNNPHLTQHSNHPVDMIVSQLLDRQRASSNTSTTSTQLAPRRLTPDNQVPNGETVLPGITFFRYNVILLMARLLRLPEVSNRQQQPHRHPAYTRDIPTRLKANNRLL